MPQHFMRTVRRSRWMVWSVPIFACLGWASESQASDILVSFEVASAESNKTASPKTSSPNSGGHILRFTPPQATVYTNEPNEAEIELKTTAIKNNQGDALVRDAAASAPLSVPAAAIPTEADTTSLPLPPLAPEGLALFEGDEDSLVAIAIGHAEGTRTVEGQKTMAYYGHVDPGNQAWNQGTFSYQHEANSPQDADRKQLTRLKRQTQELHQLAFQRGLVLTQAETLNGIDLANQAPLAALDRGYIDWLIEAKKMGLTGEDAILWARTRSFLDPDTSRWNAPGLGNSVQSISQDQARRQRAIGKVLEVNAQSASAAPKKPSSDSSRNLGGVSNKGNSSEKNEVIDGFLFTDTIF